MWFHFRFVQPKVEVMHTNLVTLFQQLKGQRLKQLQALMPQQKEPRRPLEQPTQVPQPSAPKVNNTDRDK